MAAATPLLSLALLLLLVRQSSSELASTRFPSDTKTSSSKSALPGNSQAERREGGFGRFIKFNTGKQDTMRINLEFSVPFLNVPLRSNDPSKPSAPVELNVRGILMAAGLGAVAAVVVPALTSSPGPLELPSSWSGK